MEKKILNAKLIVPEIKTEDDLDLCPYYQFTIDGQEYRLDVNELMEIGDFRQRICGWEDTLYVIEEMEEDEDDEEMREMLKEARKNLPEIVEDYLMRVARGNDADYWGNVSEAIDKICY